MSLGFAIPKPCNEDWSAMLPNEKGRHCLSCTKTVVDFTNWEVADIKQYLENQTGERVCGRFNTKDLAAKEEQDYHNIARQVWNSALPELKKMAAIICLFFSTFLAACSDNQPKQDHIVGALKLDPPTLIADSSHLSGEVLLSATADSVAQPVKRKKKPAHIVRPQIVEPQPYMEVTMGVPPLPPEPPQPPQPIPAPDTVKK